MEVRCKPAAVIGPGKTCHVYHPIMVILQAGSIVLLLYYLCIGSVSSLQLVVQVASDPQ